MSEPISVGLVGIGPWGRKLATAFSVLGFPITDYARNPKNPDINDLGRRWDDWRTMIANVKMVVCAATPAVTYDVYQECLSRRKPALLTKPLYVSELPDETMSAPIMIDYVRLWSANYQMLKKHTEKSKIANISVSFAGVGPVREFPGLYDYGPHVFAWVYDLLSSQSAYMNEFELANVEVASSAEDLLKRKIYVARGKIGDVEVSARFGNGLDVLSNRDRRLAVTFRDPTGWGDYQETPDIIKTEIDHRGSMNVLSIINEKTVVPKSPLCRMVQAFIDDAGFGNKSKPHASFRDIMLSTKIHRTLKKIMDASKETE